MAIQVLSTAFVIDRIKSAVSAFKVVEGAAELEMVVRRGARVTPAAYVVPLSDSAGAASAKTLVITQRVESKFAVAYAIKNLADGRGAKAVDELSALRRDTIAAIVGWAPEQGFDLCEFTGGSLIRVADGVVIWRDTFAVRHVNEN